ncbi:uncharacterized protein LOC133038354 [Cannabis sativa]|uniref:uncharacterized protein LOC133038354 n=1 Tax=Cannabis sativa TaxID=3483 RepID=UPI0029CA579C|nr:uncharacterized protein LOC133038354 [Cannabis sativa]
MVSNTKFSRVSKWTFYRAKSITLEMLEGSVADQYAILDDYCKQILLTNPGSTAKIQTKLEGDQRVFERVYICLKACKDGFRNGCRPLICLDGTFLKGYCKGLLLVAVGIDPENAIYPIAYAICEKETTDSWTWFCELLNQDLDNERTDLYTLMSDKQKGLENAVGRVFTGSAVRHCVRHLHSNFKDHPGLLMKQMLWAATRATNIPEFERKMVEIKEVNQAAYNWLAAKPPTEWIGLFLRRFQKKRESVKKWKEEYGRNIWKIMEQNKKIASNCLVTQSTEVIFQVDCPGTVSYAVNLIEKTCSCRRYQLSGIPCGHALATIWQVGHQVKDYVSHFY